MDRCQKAKSTVMAKLFTEHTEITFKYKRFIWFGVGYPAYQRTFFLLMQEIENCWQCIYMNSVKFR